MAIEVINRGTSANDGTGDNIREAFRKVNDNFDQVLTNDTTDYTDATTPLAGTEIALVEQGGTFKKVAVSEFGGGGGGGSSKIIGLINDAVTVLSVAQGGGVNTIMHSFLIPANEISNSLIEVDFFAVRTLGTTNPTLNFYLYVSNNNDLTGGVGIVVISLNNNNTGQQIRFSFFTESSILYRIVENTGNKNYAPVSVDFTQPVYFHFYISNGGSISGDSTRYFRHINVKAIKSI